MSTVTTNSKFNKKKCASGLDGMNFEYVLAIEGMENLYIPEEDLKNDSGDSVGKISCIGGKISVYFNAVRVIRPDNVKPFGIVDDTKLELVKITVVEFMKSYLEKHLQDKDSDVRECISNIKIKALECNLTMRTECGATPSDIINFFDLAFDKTVLYRKRKSKTEYEKINTSFYHSKPKEWNLKVYDKTVEQFEKGNLLVEKDLLRIEVVFIGRSLNKMYGDKRNLEDILTTQALVVLCNQYKRVFEEIVEKYLKPCLDRCKDCLFESLTYSQKDCEVSETIARYREFIPDVEVLRKALKKYYRFRGKEDNSKQILHYYCHKKNLGLPRGVLKTIKTFHDATG